MITCTCTLYCAWDCQVYDDVYRSYHRSSDTETIYGFDYLKQISWRLMRLLAIQAATYGQVKIFYSTQHYYLQMEIYSVGW